MKVSIYRVEQPRGGFGPYSWEFEDSLSEMFADHDLGMWSTHPGPKQDPLLGYINPGEHCGFATLAQLKEWFEGYEHELTELEFVVARYSVPLQLVRYGRTQAVFTRGDLFPEETFQLSG